MNRKYVILFFIHVVLPLLLGAAIYLTFRRGSILNSYFPHYQNESSSNINGWSFLKRLLVFSAPDFLWSYSFAAASFLLLRKHGQHHKPVLFLVFLLLLFSEAVQLFFPGRFTFDVVDLLAAIVAFVLSYFIVYKPVYEK